MRSSPDDLDREGWPVGVEDARKAALDYVASAEAALLEIQVGGDFAWVYNAQVAINRAVRVVLDFQLDLPAA